MSSIKSARGNTRHPLSPFLILMSAVLALTASSAGAGDLDSAKKAYVSGDYAAAFKGFHELAELGQPTAQYDLAAMYANGQGTRPSDIYAYAWASLAAKNGLAKAQALVDSLGPQLALAPGSDQIAKDIEAQYGNAVLDQRLFPKLAAETADSSRHERCRPVHAYTADYPEDARHQGIQGGAFAQFSVMPDGRIRNPHVIYAVPKGVFERAVRDSLLHSEFAPGAPADPPVPCTLYYRYEMKDFGKDSYPRLMKFVNDTLAQAKDGDPHAQMLYGMMLVGFPQLDRPNKEALPWFLKSAQAGTPLAQFQVGMSLLHGWGCDCEENKGLEWLRRAAESGEPNAEVTLATYALRGTPDEDRLRQAKLWLEQAATTGDHDGQLYLAALLAAAPSDHVRDPKRALTLLDTAFKGVKDDPTAFEIRAAAEASARNYQDAVGSEKKAIQMAQHLHWDLTPLDARLTHYTANQPWYGALLEF